MTKGKLFDIVQCNIILTMSSYPETAPVTLPSVSVGTSALKYAEEKPQKTPERRDTAPREQVNRRLFERVFQYVRRYSISPTEKNGEGQYRLCNEDVRNFLTAETEDLKRQDPLIKLLTLIQSGSVDPLNDDVRIGSYRLVSPSIKHLNDLYLGPNQTDDLVYEDLNKSIEEQLGQNTGEMISSNFKGGVFVMNFSQLRNGSGRSAEEVLDAKIEEIHQRAKALLRRHIDARLQALDRRRMDITEKMSIEAADDVAANSLYAQFTRVDNNIKTLEKLKWEITCGDQKVDLAFGFDRIENTDLQTLFMAIRNAECAANMAIVDAFENGHRKAMMYSHESFLIEAIRTLQLLGEFDIVEKIQTKKGHESRIREEWKKFFYHDEKGYVRMRPDTINIYRRLEKYRTSSDYQSMTPKQQSDFEQKMKKFGQYYMRINIVDVLKKFQEPNMEQYLSTASRIASLIARAEEALTPDENGFYKYEAMRPLLEETSEVLERSLKDEGENIIRTTRASIHHMMQPGQKLIMVTDNIGFGAINQASYEESVNKLVKLLNISNKEWDVISRDPQRLKLVVSKKLKKLRHDPTFTKTILGIGDLGTKHLRHNERRAHQLFGGPATVDSEMGDESKFYFQTEENPLIPDDEEQLKRRLLHFSMETKMRIAAILTNFHFSPLDEPIERLIVQDKTRHQILEFIGMMNWAAEAHDKIKDLNALGYHKAEVQWDRASENET